MRYRIHYTKTGKLRFLSQRDLLRFFERALRRTGLPLSMSEGFNPRARLSAPAPMPLGVESDDEIIEVQLSARVEPEEIRRLLAPELAAGLSVTAVEELQATRFCHPSSVEYEVLLPEGMRPSVEQLRDALGADAPPETRYSDEAPTTVDYQTYVSSVRVENDRLRLTLLASERTTAKLRDVLSRLLGLTVPEVLQLRVTKLRTNYSPEPRSEAAPTTQPPVIHRAGNS